MGITMGGGVRLLAARDWRTDRVLTPDALAFLELLHREFDDRRRVLLRASIDALRSQAPSSGR
jgi:hypothetical protein